MHKKTPLNFTFFLIFTTFLISKFDCMEKKALYLIGRPNCENDFNNYDINNKQNYLFYNNYGNGLYIEGGGDDNGTGGSNFFFNNSTSFNNSTGYDNIIKNLFSAEKFIENFKTLKNKNKDSDSIIIFTCLQLNQNNNYFFSFLEYEDLKDKKISSDFLIENIKSELERIKENEKSKEAKLGVYLKKIKKLKDFIDELYLSANKKKIITFQEMKNFQDSNIEFTTDLKNKSIENTKNFLDNNLKFKKLNDQLEKILIRNSPLTIKEIFFGSFSMIFFVYLLFKSGKFFYKKIKKF